MTNRPDQTEYQYAAHLELVLLCRAMLAGDLSFFEGALRVHALRFEIDLSGNDPDLLVFTAIVSETDHLPTQAIQHRWSPQTLQNMQPEFKEIEEWAKDFATTACNNLIDKFSI